MVLEHVQKAFGEREKSVIDLIRSYDFDFDEIGVFGSYARNEYNVLSDIDFCVIVRQKPDAEISGDLRIEAEELKADIIFVTRKYLEKDESLFACNLRRDYRRVY